MVWPWPSKELGIGKAPLKMLLDYNRRMKGTYDHSHLKLLKLDVWLTPLNLSHLTQ